MSFTGSCTWTTTTVRAVRARPACTSHIIVSIDLNFCENKDFSMCKTCIKSVLNVEVKATIIVMSCAFTLMCKVLIVQVSIAC